MSRVPSSAGEQSGSLAFCRMAVLLSLLALSNLISADKVDYLKRADGLLASGRIIEAIENYTRAIAINPRLAAAYVNRGYAYRLREDYGSAMADFTQAIEIDSGLGEAYLNRGILHKERGEIDGAISDYDRAIRLDRKLTAAYYGRGVARMLKGNLEQAIVDFDQVIARPQKPRTDAYHLESKNSQIPRAYVLRGLAWENLRDLDKALADFSAAIRLDPRSELGLFHRGETRYLQGHFALAIEDFRKCEEMAGKLKASAMERISQIKRRWLSSDPDARSARATPSP